MPSLSERCDGETEKRILSAEQRVSAAHRSPSGAEASENTRSAGSNACSLPDSPESGKAFALMFEGFCS